MRFPFDDVLRFAEWSGDSNPLHVDPEFARQTHFGRPIVHGVLTALNALAAVPRADGEGDVRAIDMEFRNAVVSDGSYDVRTGRDGEDLTVTLSAEGQLVLGMRLEFASAAAAEAGDGTSWVAAAAGRGLRLQPAVHEVEALQAGLEVLGVYPLQVPPRSAASGLLVHWQERVLALCSYVVGMEAPGLKSLFTRITVRFVTDPADAAELRYRLRTVRFDRQFRILDTALDVATPDGRLVATGSLRSYVPFSPVAGDLDDMQARLDPRAAALRGKVALIVGGSRGLGADLVASLALAGCHVYASARHDDPARRELHEKLGARGASVEFVQGDAGDARWCQETLAAIVARHGRVDLLVLNACAPPTTARLSAESNGRNADYLLQNLRLVQTPLASFVEAVNAAHGAIVYVSSSAVDHPPAGWSQYVAVKQAGEGLVRTAAQERRDSYAMIVRPASLQTSWSDTPSRVAGSIPADWVASHITMRLAQGWQAGSVDVLTEFPAFEPRKPGRAAADFSLRVAATFTTDALLPPLEFWANELELDAAVLAAPYGQVLQSLLDPSSVLNGRGRGFNVVLVRVADWLRELADEQAGDIDFVRGYLRDTLRDFDGAMRAHRAQASSETLVVVTPSHDLRSSAESILVRQAESDLAVMLDGIPGLQVMASGAWHARYGVNEDEVHDALRDHIAHIPYRDEYLYVLATVVARQLHSRLAPPRKVVVVDCDNTLWRGVVGEVGAEGVEFDEGHRALHRTLDALTQRGILVCLCSKNEEPDVWRVFESRHDLGLRRDQVVAAMINWLPKSQNLQTLAARLNLGLDSFVFIDDNPVECAEVRAGCPGVLTIQWPQEAERAARLLEHVWEFDAVKVTKEDAQRTQMYRDEFRRQELRSETLTFEDFISNLQLAVDFAPLTPEDVRRSAQLTLRTNQFNFTTVRREEGDMQALVAGGRHEIRTVRVRDRFGDYGLVGLVIAERGDSEWTLDTFLLSCRVLGRGVEHRILADLGEMAVAAGAATVNLRVETTKRNTPARSFLESVIGDEWRVSTPRAVECAVPAAVLAAVRFEPSSSADVVVADEGGSKPTAQPVDGDRLRRREEQIVRAAFELATGAALRRAADTVRSGAAPHGVAAASAASPSSSAVTHRVEAVGEVAVVVHAAFARALRVTAEHVAEVDALEALGCDSLRIVEITVALSESYPWLPATLLFEHRAVSQIVAEIVRLSAPASSSSAPAAPAAGLPGRSGVQATADIAVVGMHVRCAGADSPEQLWALLSTGRSAVKEVPADREHFLHRLEDSRPHWAGLLGESVSRFDAEFFGVSPREAEFMDPQLRLFLEVAWNALEDAGCAGEHEPDTGVFAGVMYGDYGSRANAGSENASPYRCWEGFSLANRLSQLLGFHGPSLAVDTACSSSGTALHLACAALKAGDCRVAVVGGVNLILDPDRFGSLGRLGILSPRGQCEPFGADADGTVLGEGAGVVVLRPLDDALRRGDRIYGVIKGTGLSTGSGTVGFTAPNPQAQAEGDAASRGGGGRRSPHHLVRRNARHRHRAGRPDRSARPDARLRRRRTARPRGRRDQRWQIGSIKPNIGHLEAGAGVLGLIKILLQMRHRALAPSITSAAPNPQIPFAQGRFEVQQALGPWLRPTVTVAGSPVVLPRRAALNSFGVGGANAHVIVEEAPEAAPVPFDGDRPRTCWPCRLPARRGCNSRRERSPPTSRRLKRAPLPMSASASTPDAVTSRTAPRSSPRTGRTCCARCAALRMALPMAPTRRRRSGASPAARRRLRSCSPGRVASTPAWAGRSTRHSRCSVPRSIAARQSSTTSSTARC